jgi:isopenicillin-N epimerase
MRLVKLPKGLGATRELADSYRSILAVAGFETAFTSFDGAGYIRLSAHAYNSLDDFAAFAERGVAVLGSL